LARQLHHPVRHSGEPLSWWHPHSHGLLTWPADEPGPGSFLVRSRPQASVFMGIQPARSASAEELAVRSRLLTQQDLPHLPGPQWKSSALLPCGSSCWRLSLTPTAALWTPFCGINWFPNPFCLQSPQNPSCPFNPSSGQHGLAGSIFSSQNIPLNQLLNPNPLLYVAS